MYLDPISFNVRVQHEGLFVAEISATKDLQFMVKDMIAEMAKVHHLMRTVYVTCECAGSITIWTFAYETKEDREIAHEACEKGKQKHIDRFNKAKHFDRFEIQLMGNEAVACECPFKNDFIE